MRNAAGKFGHELMRNVEKQMMLRQLDHHWKEHLAGMDHLRQGIGLRSYAQKNPKQEYKREAFEMFGAMLEQVKHDTISIAVTNSDQGRAGARRQCRATACSRGPAVSARRSVCTRYIAGAGAGSGQAQRGVRPHHRREKLLRLSSATLPRLVETSHVLAARARNTSSATASSARQVFKHASLECRGTAFCAIVLARSSSRNDFATGRSMVCGSSRVARSMLPSLLPMRLRRELREELGIEVTVS